MLMMPLAAAACLLAGPTPAGAAPGRAATAGTTWGSAHRVLTPVTHPERYLGGGVDSAACAPKGYCAAAGGYTATDRGVYTFAVTRAARGTWSKTRLLGLTHISGLSCPSAGNCVAIGWSGSAELAAVTEKDGTWGKPVSINDSKIYNVELDINALDCTSAGNCVVGGSYLYDTNPVTWLPFVVSERHGIWAKAETLPGVSSPNLLGGSVDSISCTDTTCLGIGSYTTGTYDQQVMTYQDVATARNGIWGKARLIPGLPDGSMLGPDGSLVGQVSCSPGGTCDIIATVFDTGQIFTLSERNGTWNTTPDDIPGTAGLHDTLTSLSCPAGGDCSGDGTYYSPAQKSWPPFVITEHRGTWTGPQSLTGLRSPQGRNYLPSVGQVSCSAAGTCAATGYAYVYLTPALIRIEAFVINQVRGTWQPARIIPGIIKLAKDGSSDSTAIACASAAPSRCIAGGSFQISGVGDAYPFVVAENRLLAGGRVVRRHAAG
jgi:hypothetical protein